jgi:homoserine O-acetyltransferase
MAIMRKVLISLLAVVLSGIMVGAGVVQAGAEPQVAPQAAASATPSTRTPVINPRNEDVTYRNYTFRDGQTLPQLRLHYALLGTPHYKQNGAVDNAILLLHWTEASSQNLLTPEFQEALFAPGAPFDITRYFVIIPDDIGHGQSSKPSDGLKTSFPQYGYDDMVDLQHKLVTETLGISHLHAVVGMSMGCMNAWQWAEEYPDALPRANQWPKPVVAAHHRRRNQVRSGLRWRELPAGTAFVGRGAQRESVDDQRRSQPASANHFTRGRGRVREQRRLSSRGL